MSFCSICPRKCGVNRDENAGFCGEKNDIRIARASLHMWEEPCISGKEGSGTVFFSGCNLKCVYCQNSKIAIGDVGHVISENELIKTFFDLKEKGANNINLVTPSHFVPQIRSALISAKKEGLDLPIVYNTSSYESVEALKSLEGLIDVYLPDMKYVSSDISRRYSNAPDYFEVARAAIAEMVRQQPKAVFDGNDLDTWENTHILKGVIVRHLVLPSHVEESKKVIKYLYETYGDSIYISIMNQFTPVTDLSRFPEINRKVTQEEYDEVVDFAIDLGLENGFIQEGDTASESFIPDFH
ncbi:MAG: radical SAM protein [Lachnospiraceae bacterium]|nr:radical SAM protein [Lachnospiraceae bacterium]